jgi:hypothetical protein
MKQRLITTLLQMALCTLGSNALTSTTWYVNGVSGSDSNDCKSSTPACKTIGHAISLASSGDTIGVGPATYIENLTIGFGLKVIGSGAATTIIDGGRVNRVVAISGAAHVTLSNLTIRNGSTGSSGGIFSDSGTATLQNSILANNPSGGSCSGIMTSNGYNLSSDGTCNFNGPGDLNNSDPKLGQLGNYGGPTQTIPLLSGSPAIDAGNPSGCTDGLGHLLKTDQRGDPRPNTEDTGGCDRGAYERQSD